MNNMLHIPEGIPTISVLEQISHADWYRELVVYSARFIDRFRKNLRLYNWSISGNSFEHWSRRWEYPFVWTLLNEFISNNSADQFRILDAGSGLTFFPWYLAERLPRTNVICCDVNRSYTRKFQALSSALGQCRVCFRSADIRAMPFPHAYFDVLYCVSVLEHADDHERILEEFHRVVKPGGLIVVTFDISLDGRTNISPHGAQQLLQRIGQRFCCDARGWLAELTKLQHNEKILTTDYTRAVAPHLLPWRFPRLKSLYDFLCGRGFSGGFFSLTCFGLSVRVPG